MVILLSFSLICWLFKALTIAPILVDDEHYMIAIVLTECCLWDNELTSARKLHAYLRQRTTLIIYKDQSALMAQVMALATNAWVTSRFLNQYHT